jgi:hypothetical protein
MADPLLVGGAIFGKAGGTNAVTVVGRQVGKTSSRMETAGKVKTASVQATIGDLSLGSLGAALVGDMGAFERAWVKAGWADMSPAPATSYAPQGAALPATGTAPHAASHAQVAASSYFETMTAWQDVASAA